MYQSGANQNLSVIDNAESSLLSEKIIATNKVIKIYVYTENTINP